MRIHYHTFGCKANQYDTERMRQELEARGAATVEGPGDAEVVVVNTCTVTNQADADARRLIRRLRRDHPSAQVVVAGCSAALKADDYRGMGVDGVVEGHDPVAVAGAALAGASTSALVQLSDRRTLDRLDTEPVGAELLRRRRGATRGWLKIQDGCDRKCAFCATRLARGASRSRAADEVVAEARVLARSHPELVLTGVHIGHYGLDLGDRATTLGTLLGRLLDAVPDTRFRLGSIEATEIDDRLLDLMAGSGGRVAPHLHMPLQSGADPVLRRMRRWHTREQYRTRALEIAERLPVLGLGADVITGFPGETDDDHRSTADLVDELPFTYLHVFPFSPRDDTVAAQLQKEMPVPQRVAGERSRDLRERVAAKGARYRAGRVGQEAEVVLEDGGRALTGDYLRVTVAEGARGEHGSALRRGRLHSNGDDLYIDLFDPVTAHPAHAS
ncbi:MiaB/RimO family radical SAM methylthiotransferase [Gaopeijia maritima]|uniref:MiaB/RimO family radical SAM methylthiotransferase n=1 Tax=Gaopeijia maritima TaxID=3119007 RepID=UPI003246C87D